jgi:hypothetical protein
MLGRIQSRVARARTGLEILEGSSRTFPKRGQSAIETPAQDPELIRRRLAGTYPPESLGEARFRIGAGFPHHSLRQCAPSFDPFSIVKACSGVDVVDGRTRHVCRDEASNAAVPEAANMKVTSAMVSTLLRVIDSFPGQMQR